MASAEQFTITVEHAVFKAMPSKADSDGTPVVTLSCEVRGRGAIEKLAVADLMCLLGKPVTLKVIDNQLRIKED